MANKGTGTPVAARLRQFLPEQFQSRPYLVHTISREPLVPSFPDLVRSCELTCPLVGTCRLLRSSRNYAEELH